MAAMERKSTKQRAAKAAPAVFSYSARAGRATRDDSRGCAIRFTGAEHAQFALLAVLVLLAFGALTGIARGDEPASVTLTTEQAQARQFGMFFGGTASQFDLCVKKGFLSPGKQSAEDIAKAVLEKIRASNTGTDQSAFVQEGWDYMKKEITDNESFYTQARCNGVGREWAKLLANLPKK
jgi:hypothetical protein